MTNDPIDHDIFMELKETTGDEFAAELVMTFLDEADGLTAELKSAAESGDADGFRRAAHSIKSNANTFGAIGLADLARELELGGLQQQSETNQAKIAALEEALHRAVSALKSVIDG